MQYFTKQSSEKKSSYPFEFKSVHQFEFKKEYPLEKRKVESATIKNKYPDRIPVVCEVLKSSDSNEIILDKKKYLVPSDITVGQFIYIIRKRIILSAEHALYVFIDNTLPPTNALMGQIYNDNKDIDGFLYCLLSRETSFG
jgi:GABA(A) receptor-associated protein